MLYNQANMDALFTSLNVKLNQGLSTARTEFLKYAMIINSATAIEKYPAVMLTGKMRKWVGPRVVNRLSTKTIDVRNEDFENTQAIGINDIEDDAFGIFAPIFEELGIEAGNLWARLAAETLLSPGKWADGADFFSATRKFEKSVINNVVSGALSISTYETARAQMMGFKNYNGEALGLVPTHLIVGSSLEATAKKIFKADLVAENGVAVSNIHQGDVEVVIDPYLTGTKWFLTCGNRGLQPIAIQKRKAGALVRADKETDECVRKNNEAEYMLHYRGAGAAVCPHLIIGGNL